MMVANHSLHHHGQDAGCQHSHHHGQHNHQHMIADFRKRFWFSLLITIPILLLSPFLQQIFGWQQALGFEHDDYVLLALATLIYIYGGAPFLTGLWYELSSRQPGMMTLIAIAISTAYLYSGMVVLGLSGKTFFWELATLIDLMLLGHWIEMKSVMGASQALQKLAELMPTSAHKVTDEGLLDVEIASLLPNDLVIVKPGEKVPTDGLVVEGKSSVNQALLTGESMPVSKAKDDRVIAGSLNGEGALTVKVEKTGKDSFLAKVIDLVEQAQQSKSRTQNLANRAAVWLTLIALSGGP
ncbi:HAD-IC family P-type ATPase [Thiomicrorhabdus sediminis]|uniref:HAD-IC family P-type ATPase n=1 Tax=Thiomicrorhabdus sediminis TaxID=2580412 RepID=UPI0023AF6D21|nr:HAD-IC family P-type ATPase [Thiomicrorhabdus sediminis]